MEKIGMDNNFRQKVFSQRCTTSHVSADAGSHRGKDFLIMGKSITHVFIHLRTEGWNGEKHFPFTEEN